MLQKYKINRTSPRNHVWKSPIDLKTCSACSKYSNYYVPITVCPTNSTWAPRYIHLKLKLLKIAKVYWFSLQSYSYYRETTKKIYWISKDFTDFHQPISELNWSWLSKQLLEHSNSSMCCTLSSFLGRSETSRHDFSGVYVLFCIFATNHRIWPVT